MCGIGAIIGESSPEAMAKMLDLMHHRGPDEDDIVNQADVILGHKRLSIIGPESGIQPISNETKDVWIVCNGEIYNYQTLKDKHLQGHVFKRDSDSEVPLHLYEEYGNEFVNYLDGMFAFIIADYRQGEPTIFAARDPMGIKPLYYGEKKGTYFFASELKCLFGVVDEIHEFPQGHYYTPATGFVPYRIIQAPQLKEKLPEDHDLANILQNVRKLLEKAVQKRLMADVPLGVFLSGGLDSSLVSAIANKYYSGEKLKSFSVGLEGSSDLIAAREVAQYLGTEHYEYIYTEEELWNAIPKVIYHLESFEPSLVRSAIPNYFVSQLAAKHVKVILSGEGADELFSGYAYMKKIANLEALDKELVRALSSLHNINLQRLDRVTMAHSLEGRVPFLDEELINYSLRTPVKWKLFAQKENKIEKWILRKAFEKTGYLPENILWRKKEEFSEGSGAKDTLEQRLDQEISDKKLEKEKKIILATDGLAIRSKQELHFYKIFKKYYPHPSATAAVGRWATA